MELLPVDADLDLVRIDPVAHPIAAFAVDDVHVDTRRLVDLAGDADDHPRRRLSYLRPVRQPTPKVIIGIAGEIYRTPRINVNIVHGRCSDGMSDRTYPDKVQVTVDGRRFEGCGGL